MIFFDTKIQISELLGAIEQAKSSIEIEIYIWDADSVGQKFEDAVIAAALRGVSVRIIVDRIGSYSWIAKNLKILTDHGVQVRIFRPWMGFKKLLTQMFPLWKLLNRRDHRKIFIIDKKVSYVGSFNILDDVLKWKETVVRVDDPKDIQVLSSIFDHTWDFLKDFKSRFTEHDEEEIISQVLKSKSIRTTQTKKLRAHYRKDYLRRLRNAKDRIWLVTPYFNAPRYFLRALVAAAKRGVDVRLMVPEKTDPAWFSYLSRLYYGPLVKRKLKIYVYPKHFIHSKTAVIDNTALVGSGNLNYRSFARDLELNVVVKDPKDVEALEQNFIRDMHTAHEISDKQQLAWWERSLGGVLSVFKTSF